MKRFSSKLFQNPYGLLWESDCSKQKRARSATEYSKNLKQVWCNDVSGPIKNVFPSKREVAFTLAEVLISLGIIGVVAAMTIPSLVTKYQKKQTVNQLKKVYSEIQQAAQMYQSQNGIMLTEFDTSLGAQAFMNEYLSPYLNIIRNCNNIEACYGNKKPLAINRKTELQVDYLAVLYDGTFLGLRSVPGGILFYTDLNGVKNPNRSGHDIFYFWLVNNSTFTEHKGCEWATSTIESSFYPGGYSNCYVPFTKYSRDELLGTSHDRTCNIKASGVSSGGDACAALIMLDGWEIKDDYPW